RAAELSGCTRADVPAGAIPDDRGVPGHACGACAEGPAARALGRRAVLRVCDGAREGDRVLVPRSRQRDHVRLFRRGVESDAGAVSAGLGDARGSHFVGCPESRLRRAVMKALLRTKSIATKVTGEKYARRALAVASGRNMSEWVRDVLESKA